MTALSYLQILAFYWILQRAKLLKIPRDEFSNVMNNISSSKTLRSRGGVLKQLYNYRQHAHTQRNMPRYMPYASAVLLQVTSHYKVCSKLFLALPKSNRGVLKQRRRQRKHNYYYKSFFSKFLIQLAYNVKFSWSWILGDLWYQVLKEKEKVVVIKTSHEEISRPSRAMTVKKCILKKVLSAY